MSSEPWYAVRCVFHFPWGDPPGVYEERITLWKADSFDEAIERAEIEAAEYIADGEGRYVGLAQSFHLAAGESVNDGAEVFSLMRDSTLDGDEYVDRFFDTGAERQTDGDDRTSAAPTDAP